MVYGNIKSRVCPDMESPSYSIGGQRMEKKCNDKQDLGQRISEVIQRRGQGSQRQ